MSSWRRRLVAAMSEELGTARGEARFLADRTAAAARSAGKAAEAAAAEAERKRAKFTAIHERVTATLGSRRVQTVGGAAAAVSNAASLAAPVAAGAPWRGWIPYPALAEGPAPLLRVGTVDGSATEDEPALPALVALLDRGHLSLAPDAAEALPGLLLRALGAVPAGAVRLRVYDPERLGGSLRGFAPLGEAGLLSSIGPSGLREELDALVEDVRRVNADVLAGDHASLAGLAAATGRRPEPWRVLVLIDSDIDAWPAHERAQLARLRRAGVGAGVHLLAVGDDGAGELHDLPRLTATDYTGLPGAPLRLDPAPPERTVTAAAETIAGKHRAGREPARFVDLLPGRLRAASSAAGLDGPRD